MSTVLSKFKKYFEQKGLRRIRFKVDPTLKDGFSNATTYEGYILSENFDHETVIYIPVGDQMGLHGISGILPIPDELQPLKNEITKKLKGKPGEEYLPQIYNSNCFDEIQTYLKHAGLTDGDIIDILKEIIPYHMSNPVACEGFNPLKMIAKGGEKLAQLKNKADRYTAYLKTFDPAYLPNKKDESQRNSMGPILNPSLTATPFKVNNDFLQWFNKKYKYNNDFKKIKTLLDSLSSKQLNYYAQKFYEQTGILIS